MTTLKEVSTTIKVGALILGLLVPGVTLYHVNASNDKINRIASASIREDESIREDLKELRQISIDNAKQIAAQDAAYESDSKWIVSSLTRIEGNIKELKDRRP